MFYERFAGKIVADLCGVVLSIGLINLMYELTRDGNMVHSLHIVDKLCLLAMIALTCAFTGYHALAFRIDLASMPMNMETGQASISATKVISLYLIDLAALASLAGMFGSLSIIEQGPHLSPEVFALSALFAAVWHLFMGIWHYVRSGKFADAGYHCAFSAWYGLFSLIFFLVPLNGPGQDNSINLYAIFWVFGFTTGLGFLYFGRFRKIVARGIADFEAGAAPQTGAADAKAP